MLHDLSAPISGLSMAAESIGSSDQEDQAIIKQVICEGVEVLAAKISIWRAAFGNRSKALSQQDSESCIQKFFATKELTFIVDLLSGQEDWSPWSSFVLKNALVLYDILPKQGQVRLIFNLPHEICFHIEGRSIHLNPEIKALLNKPLKSVNEKIITSHSIVWFLLLRQAQEKGYKVSNEEEMVYARDQLKLRYYKRNP